MLAHALIANDTRITKAQRAHITQDAATLILFIREELAYARRRALAGRRTGLRPGFAPVASIHNLRLALTELKGGN